jgi:hypothetical protein
MVPWDEKLIFRNKRVTLRFKTIHTIEKHSVKKFKVILKEKGLPICVRWSLLILSFSFDSC